MTIRLQTISSMAATAWLFQPAGSDCDRFVRVALIGPPVSELILVDTLS
jgi:hypothetical protein